MSTTSNCCDACGKVPSDNDDANEGGGTVVNNLKKCSRCHYVEYCSKDCQINHWKKIHKSECDNAKKLMEQGHTKQETRRLLLDIQVKDHRRTLRKHLKLCTGRSNDDDDDGTATTEERVVHMSMTAFGLVGPGMAIPEGVPSNFHLKQQAILELQRYRPTDPLSSSSPLGNLKGEKAYLDYFNDIKEFQEEWMAFFQHPNNIEHCEHTCGILGTLATIYRQRGTTFDKCEQVLDLEKQVLKYYGEHCHNSSIANHYGGGRPATIRCYEGLLYKYNIIRYNLNNQLERYKDNIPIFRSQIEYEFRYDIPFEKQEYLFLIEVILGSRRDPRTTTSTTLQELKLLRDEEILKMIMAPILACKEETAKTNKKLAKRVALWTCANCNAQETTMMQYKECGRCQKVHYCNKKCQQAHWKQHKKVCNK